MELQQFYIKEVCRSNGHCSTCRTSREWRESVAKVYSLSEVDFKCRRGFPIGKFGSFLSRIFRTFGFEKTPNCGCTQREQKVNLYHSKILSFFRSK